MGVFIPGGAAILLDDLDAGAVPILFSTRSGF